MDRRFLLLAAALLAAGAVFAAQGEIVSTTVGQSGQFTEAAIAGNATAEGGNVTRVDLAGTYSTARWQGFYGNVTASIVLGLGVNVFYSFPEENAIAVYATPDSSFNWAGIAGATANQVDNAWSFGSGSDQAEDIFIETIAAIDGLSDVPSTTMEDENFKSYLVNDGSSAVKNDFAFGGEVIPAGAEGFDGATWEYELLVPVGAVNEVYYFFMSI